MKVLTCAQAWPRLQAFHDGELSISEQISIGQHLEWCDRCAESLEELRALGTALRGAAPARAGELPDAGFQAAVVARLKAENAFSFVGRTRALFEDMHLMYVSVGAVVATCACVAIVSGMIRFATTERPDSLAAIMNLVGALPGSNENPVLLDPTVLVPRALDEAIFVSVAGDDAVYALSAVVTREGRVENLELLHPSAGSTEANESKRVETLLDSVARARFEPARLAGLPVAVNMVWLVANTTVRGDKDQRVQRPGRKRTAELLSTPAAAV